jgi:hypothetical protein
METQMKTQEFYRKAKEDALFRNQQIAAAQEQKRMAVMVGAVMVVGWVGYTIYCLSAESRWPGEVGVGFGLVLCASVYAPAQTRLGGLEALQ